jgi:mannose-6-phosphate isomerase-like protein (cupin superfamily)
MIRNANERISLADKFASFEEHWSPRIVGELNGQYVKLAKLKGEFVWHQHDAEDELFLVIKGELRLELRDREIVLREGELAVIPKGTQHRPSCSEEVQVLLFEPQATVNTGDVRNELTTDCAWL